MPPTDNIYLPLKNRDFLNLYNSESESEEYNLGELEEDGEETLYSPTQTPSFVDEETVMEVQETPKTSLSADSVEMGETNVKRRLLFVCRQLFKDDEDDAN